MKRFSSFRASLLAAFVLLTLGVAACMCAAGWAGSSSLGRHLLEKQAARIMATLIEAERQALAARDKGQEETMESAGLAEVLDWRFLVGKQVPGAWRDLGAGMHFLAPQKQFVLIAREAGSIYALSGSIDEYYSLRGEAMALLLACGALGIAAAAILALALSRYLSGPLLKLTQAVEERRGEILPPKESPPPFPEKLLALNNEVGVLARQLAKNEADLHAFIWRESCFNGDVSHELRTPLTILRGGLELLERDLQQLPEAARNNNLDVVQRLMRTVDEMAATVHALLLLARDPQKIDDDSLNRSFC